MKKPLHAALLALFVAGAFLAGSWCGQRRAARLAPAGERKVLYYVDPMHPAYRSDKPGIAPDCGMPLEPVYADAAGGPLPAGPAGAVKVSPEKQQTLGVRLGVVERASGSQTLRTTKPGLVARVSAVRGTRSFAAQVSDVLPRFDPGIRTLKVRLETDNPGYALRPDMFVDVEIPVELGPAITVPKEAVIDSGTQRVVYVDKGEGFFEPRKVETGFRQGDRVEIISGLAEGEKVVTSGSFLFDSESRMRAAGAEETPEAAVRAHGEARAAAPAAPS